MRGSQSETQENIRWEAKHVSDAWEHFDQVAHHITGEPMVMCRLCGTILPYPHQKKSGTNTMKRHASTEKCRKGAKSPATQQTIQATMKHAATLNSSPQSLFSTDEWEREQIEFITAFNLPFRSLARRQLASLIKIAQIAPSEPPLLHPRTAQRRLQKLVQEEHYSILSTLPPHAKLSIALDCWTSPSKYAFMVITGYFIDRNWNYREILLGFEPLDGPHSGLNLSSVLIELFKKHDITSRILAVTSDNASNNTTLVKAVQELIDSLQLPGNPVIVRIPCLAHVIQLSLRELLGSVKADPQNDEVDKTISDVQAQARALRATQSQKAIVSTLVKIRGLAVYINHSPQRRETFLSLQPREPRLIPIQDVRTRWNSTFLMLRRAKRISKYFNLYCEHIERPELKLNKAEWRQIDYLLFITEPFYRFTTVLSKTKDMTVHNVFRVYNALFDHFEKSIDRLTPKSIPWKVAMLNALHAGIKKLSVYYTKTKEIHGSLYAIGTILAPQQKLSFFSSKAWGRELNQYLDTPRKQVNPLLFWKEYEEELPILSSVARDILSIPATGAGVERLFNSARDVCHYRRGQLNPTTIQDIMMFRCKSRFDFETEVYEEDTPLITVQEGDEKMEAELTSEEPEPISEGEDSSDDEDINDPVTVIEDDFLLMKMIVALRDALGYGV
ncbi:HAT dimerization [Penicillium atrosanguineum]|uniref:HAT dimerization n=1 Tax=Penicillium atrosanguineum TaxID=1132637 RepID=A0A9W9U5L4_9EURO|nr:HAT dimerization [Penicillium atrosanguineum]